MKNKKKLAAFSMIELSIAVIVIGMLVAGVIGGKKLISLSNITKARALTNSSPVNGIKDLVLWIETTSRSSFDSMPANNTPISNWRDINPQSNVKNHLRGLFQGSSTYVENSINGLPALYDPSYTGNITINNDTLTVFIVAKRNALVADAAAVTLYNQANYPYNYNNNAVLIADLNSISSISLLQSSRGGTKAFVNNPALQSPYIFTTIFDGANNTIYLNGVASAPVASSGNFDIANIAMGPRATSPTGALSQYNGYVGEVIIFSRALKASERTEIESYLSRKWGIKLT